MHNVAYIAMGTNMPFLGVSGAALLRQAVTAMRAEGLAVQAASGVWQTDAWPPGSKQPDYYNAVVSIDVAGLSPQAIYQKLRSIETAFGRTRREQWAARTLDLDLVAVAGLAGVFGELTVPHARMHERSFVLAPLAEIAPEWRHPRLGKTAAELLAALPGNGYRRVDDLVAGAG
jgi:2-amino-4-hydroxy-6-hydroxymethyldihydropteridine diphosphokinase